MSIYEPHSRGDYDGCGGQVALVQQGVVWRVIPRGKAQLQLVGNIGETRTAADTPREAAAVENLVAGTRNTLHLEFASAAA